MTTHSSSDEVFIHVALLCSPSTHYTVDRYLVPLLQYFSRGDRDDDGRRDSDGGGDEKASRQCQPHQPAVQIHISTYSEPPSSLLDTVDLFIICYSPVHPRSFWEVRDRWLPSIAHQHRALRVLCAVGVDLCGSSKVIGKLGRVIFPGGPGNCDDGVSGVLSRTGVEPTTATSRRQRRQEERVMASLATTTTTDNGIPPLVAGGCRSTGKSPQKRRGSMSSMLAGGGGGGVARRIRVRGVSSNANRQSISLSSRRRSVDPKRRASSSALGQSGLLPINALDGTNGDVVVSSPPTPQTLPPITTTPYSSTVALMLYHGAFAELNHSLLLKVSSGTSVSDELRLFLWIAPSLPGPARHHQTAFRCKIGAALLAVTGLKTGLWPGKGISGGGSDSTTMLSPPVTSIIASIASSNTSSPTLSFSWGSIINKAGSFQSMWTDVVDHAHTWVPSRDVLPLWVEHHTHNTNTPNSGGGGSVEGGIVAVVGNRRTKEIIAVESPSELLHLSTQTAGNSSNPNNKNSATVSTKITGSTDGGSAAAAAALLLENEWLSQAEGLRVEEERSAFKTIRILSMESRNLTQDVQRLEAKVTARRQFQDERMSLLFDLEDIHRQKLQLEATSTTDDMIFECTSLVLQEREKELQKSSTQHIDRGHEIDVLLSEKADRTTTYIEHWERNRDLHRQIQRNDATIVQLTTGAPPLSHSEVWSKLSAHDKELYTNHGVAIPGHQMDKISASPNSPLSLSSSSVVRSLNSVQQDIDRVAMAIEAVVAKDQAVWETTVRLLKRRMQLEINGVLVTLSRDNSHSGASPNSKEILSFTCPVHPSHEDDNVVDNTHHTPPSMLRDAYSTCISDPYTSCLASVSALRGIHTTTDSNNTCSDGLNDSNAHIVDLRRLWVEMSIELDEVASGWDVDKDAPPIHIVDIDLLSSSDTTASPDSSLSLSYSIDPSTTPPHQHLHQTPTASSRMKAVEEVYRVLIEVEGMLAFHHIHTLRCQHACDDIAQPLLDAATRKLTSL